MKTVPHVLEPRHRHILYPPGFKHSKPKSRVASKPVEKPKQESKPRKKISKTKHKKSVEKKPVHLASGRQRVNIKSFTS